MSDSNYPAPFGPLTDAMRFGTSSPTIVTCAACGASCRFLATAHFPNDLAHARWERAPEVGGDIYLCPECSQREVASRPAE